MIIFKTTTNHEIQCSIGSLFGVALGYKIDQSELFGIPIDGKKLKQLSFQLIACLKFVITFFIQLCCTSKIQIL